MNAESNGRGDSDVERSELHLFSLALQSNCE